MQPQIPATTGRLSTPSAAADSARGDKFLGECAANTGVSLNVRGWCSFPGLKSPGSLRNPRFTTVLLCLRPIAVPGRDSQWSRLRQVLERIGTVDGQSRDTDESERFRVYEKESLFHD